MEVPPLRLCGGRGHPAGLAWRVGIFVSVVEFTGLEMTPYYFSGLIVGSMWRSIFMLPCYSCYSSNIRKAACTGFLMLSILFKLTSTMLTIALVFNGLLLVINLIDEDSNYQAPKSWREKRHGYHHRWLSLLDVEGGRLKKCDHANFDICITLHL